MKKKALVCDDTPVMQMGIKAILGMCGFDVTTVKDGREAWDLVQKEKFDILFSDIEMPNMNGFELLAKVKQSAALKALPVVLCSTLNKTEHFERGKKLGACSYVVKPLNKEGLDKALKSAGLA